MTTRQSHKRRGSKFEIDLVAWLRKRGYQAERLARAGKDDEGDVAVRYGFGYALLEAKAPGAGNPISLAAWIKEVLTEAENFRAKRNLSADDIHPLVVIKARGKALDDAYIVMRLADFFGESFPLDDDTPEGLTDGTE